MKVGKYELTEDEIKSLEESEVGSAFLEYWRVFKDEPFPIYHGMPDVYSKYGGVDGLYRECIRRGLTWRELILEDFGARWMDDTSDDVDI